MKITSPLQKEETLQLAQKELKRLESENFVGGGIVDSSLELLYSLNSALKAQELQDAKMRSAYQAVVARLSSEMLPFLSTADALSFIGLYFSEYVRLDAAGDTFLFSKLRGFFLREDFYKREGLINSTVAAIRQSKSKIGSDSISHWIGVYIKAFGAERHDKVTIREFVRENSEVRKMSLSDRKVLSRALRYYEALRMDRYDISNPACDPLSMWGVDPRTVRINQDLYDIQRPERELSESPSRPAPAPKPQSNTQGESKKKIESQPKKPQSSPAQKKLSTQKPPSKPIKSMSPEEMLRSAQLSPKKHYDVSERMKKDIDQISSSVVVPAKKELGKKPESVQKNSEKSFDFSTLSVDSLSELGKSSKEILLSVQQMASELKKKRSAEQMMAEWKKSPLYNLYLSMGRESMQRGVSIADLAKSYQSEHKPFLTQEQFEIVARISSLI